MEINLEEYRKPNFLSSPFFQFFQLEVERSQAEEPDPDIPQKIFEVLSIAEGCQPPNISSNFLPKAIQR